jgi:putative flavoprotein involved in K+ transport
MTSTDVVVIGGGQAGLAAGWCAREAGVDHVILEQGRIAQRWRSGSWDSLRLLTPRWQSRLPGQVYRGPAPDGYMSTAELIGYLEGYAHGYAANLRENTRVLAVRAAAQGRYRVQTDAGVFEARGVIVATGHCQQPCVPAFAARLDPSVLQLSAPSYRNPDQLPAGGVLVVGASATGLQLSEEIVHSGRPVTLAVGPHTRVPRSYRGRDLLWWLDRAGILKRPAESVSDLGAARRVPSFQLVGGEPRRTLDLPVLLEAGVRLTGRLHASEGPWLHFAPTLPADTRDAHQRMYRLLDRIDVFADELDGPSTRAARPAAFLSRATPDALHVGRERIRTLLWATGFRRDYAWLNLPVLDQHGEILHRGGVTPVRGLYVLGLPFLRRRDSSFLDGVGADAHAVLAHLRSYLDGTLHSREAA